MPHPDGYLSFVRFSNGIVKRTLQLSTNSEGFPDIVTPLILVGDTIFLASFDAGIFAVDVSTGQVIRRVEIKGIVQLATDGQYLFAAKDGMLYRFSDDLVRQDFVVNFGELRSKRASLGWPFNRQTFIGQRVLSGMNTRLLIKDKHIFMGTSLGGMAIFDKETGELVRLVGEALGFGPNIGMAGDSVVGMTTAGWLVEFGD